MWAAPRRNYYRQHHIANQVTKANPKLYGPSPRVFPRSFGILYKLGEACLQFHLTVRSQAVKRSPRLFSLIWYQGKLWILEDSALPRQQALRTSSCNSAVSACLRLSMIPSIAMSNKTYQMKRVLPCGICLARLIDARAAAKHKTAELRTRGFGDSALSIDANLRLVQ